MLYIYYITIYNNSINVNTEIDLKNIIHRKAIYTKIMFKNKYKSLTS